VTGKHGDRHALLRMAQPPPQAGASWPATAGAAGDPGTGATSRKLGRERLGNDRAGFLELLDRPPDTAMLLPLHRKSHLCANPSRLLGHHPRAFLTSPWITPLVAAESAAPTLLLSRFRAPAGGGPLPWEAGAGGCAHATRGLRQSRPERPAESGTDSEAIVREGEPSAG